MTLITPFQELFVIRRLGLLMVSTYVPNLKSLTSPIMNIAKAKQMYKNGVVWSS